MASTAVVTVLHGVYSNNGGDGLRILDTAMVSLTNVEAGQNGLDGVEVEETASGSVNRVQVAGGNFSGNGDDGMELQGTTLDVNASRTRDNFEDGLQVVAAENVRLTRVNSSGNREDGMDIDRVAGVVSVASATVQGNGQWRQWPTGGMGAVSFDNRRPLSGQRRKWDADCQQRHRADCQRQCPAQYPRWS